MMKDWPGGFGQGGIKDVVVTREDGAVVVTFKKRFGTFELFAPPLAEIGYGGLLGMDSSVSKPSLLGAALIWASKVPPWLWLAIAVMGAVALVAQALRARKATRQ